MLVSCVSSVFDAYKKLSGSDIEDSIEGETAGNLENLLLAVGKTHDLSAPHQIDQTHREQGLCRNQSQNNIRLHDRNSALHSSLSVPFVFPLLSEMCQECSGLFC